LDKSKINKQGCGLNQKGTWKRGNDIITITAVIDFFCSDCNAFDDFIVWDRGFKLLEIKSSGLKFHLFMTQYNLQQQIVTAIVIIKFKSTL